MISFKTFSKNNWILMLVAFVSSICSNLLTIVIPISIGKYYELVFDVNSVRGQLLDYFPLVWFDTISHFFVFFAALIVVKLFFLFVSRLSLGIIGEQLIFNVRQLLFKSQLIIPVSTYKEKGTGKYLLRFSGDLTSIKNYYLKGILKFGSDVVLLILAFSVVGLLNINIAGLLLLILVCGVFSLAFIVKILKEKSIDLRNRKSNLLSFVSQTLNIIGSIQIHNKEYTEQLKFDKLANRAKSAGIKYQLLTSLILTLIPGLCYLMLFSVLGYSYAAKSTGLGDAELLVVIMLIITLLPAIRRVLRINIVWEMGKISMIKLNRVLQSVSTDVNKTELSKQDIKTISITVGSNKSTLLVKGINRFFGKVHFESLIDKFAGLDDPVSGEILINGKDLTHFNRRKWRKNVSVLDMRYDLIGKTVFEVVSYSRKADNREKAAQIVMEVQAAFNSKYKMTLDDKIGRAGSMLSKEQKQLLMVTRVLLANKPILFINEFDGILNNNQRFKKYLESALKGKFVITNKEFIYEFSLS